MGKTKELAKNTAIILIGKIFTQFLSFFLLPLYTHFLPASDYGLVDLLLTYITLLAPAITIQQEMATFRFLIDARNDEKEIANIVRTSFISCSKRLLLFVIPCIAVALFVRWHYLYLVIAAGGAMIFSNLLLQIARGMGENIKYSIASVLTGALTISSNLLLICGFHFGAESVLISMALANVICSLYLAISLRVPHYLRIGKNNKRLRKDMLKFSWPLVPNSISWWFINTSDHTIVSTFLGTAVNGIYTVALKFPSIIGSLLSITVLSWTESASLHINDSDRDEFFSSVANIFIKAFVGLSVLIIAAIPFVFNIIIGEEYRAAYEYVPIIMISVLMSCIVGIYSAIYVAKKMTKQVASISAVSAIINIVINISLIGIVGLYAAPISTVLAYAFMAIYRHYDLKKYVRIKYKMADVIPAVVCFTVVALLYYSGNFYCYVIGAIIAAIYAIISNKHMIRNMLRYVVTKKNKAVIRR